MKELNERELLFCRLFLSTRNAREAAVRAGFKVFPERTGIKLLAREDIKAQISRCEGENKHFTDEAAAGLRRIAFSGVTDAVKLLYREDADEKALEELDLFNVSEIKRPKGGGMEIKFFDRIKALEKLCEMDGTRNTDAGIPFYNALIEGAKNLKTPRNSVGENEEEF